MASSALTSLSFAALVFIKGPKGEENPERAVLINTVRIIGTAAAASLCLTAIVAQKTRMPWDDEDWTLAASIGAGICTGVVLTHWVISKDWVNQFPKGFVGLGSVVVLIGCFQLVFRVLLRRKSEPDQFGDE
jgi:hypothetical protein